MDNTKKRSFDATRSALLIVDMQNDYLHEDGGFSRLAREKPFLQWDMDGLRATIAPISQLRQAFHRAGRPVIFIVMTHTPDYSDAQWPHWRLGLTCSGAPFLVEGSWGAEIVEALTPRDSDLVVKKRAYNGFADTALDTILHRFDIHDCVVCGITTAVCVSSTIRGAVDRNYAVTLVNDATAETSRELHQAESRILSLAFADERSTKEVIEMIETRVLSTGVNEFRKPKVNQI